MERWANGALSEATDLVAEEVPVALVYHEVPHVVMLATPADLEDYGVGFTLSEGLVARREEIRGVEVTHGAGVADVHISVAWERFTAAAAAPPQPRRPHRLRAVRGGDRRRCDPRAGPGARRGDGRARRSCTPPSSSSRHDSRSMPAPAACTRRPGCCPGRASSSCARTSAVTTRSTRPSGPWRAAARTSSAGYMLITSRASYEMVQKCATVGISLLVALSAPTAFAVRLAQQTGLTLVAFARRDKHVVYAHRQRIT